MTINTRKKNRDRDVQESFSSMRWSEARKYSLFPASSLSLFVFFFFFFVPANWTIYLYESPARTFVQLQDACFCFCFSFIYFFSPLYETLCYQIDCLECKVLVSGDILNQLSQYQYGTFLSLSYIKYFKCLHKIYFFPELVILKAPLNISKRIREHIWFPWKNLLVSLSS